MSPIIEAHLIQSLQPNNLNRDDTGAPKSAVFGGWPRRRVSSQSLKRAQREYMRDRNLLDPSDLGVRTKRLIENVTGKLVAKGRPEEAAESVAKVAALALGFGVEDKTNKTEYLVFTSDTQIEQVTTAADEVFDQLAQAADKVKKKADVKKLPDEVKEKFEGILDSSNAVDIALFGRMLADIPESNVEAACHVAHALSTHAVDEEWDYFTAVDDLKPDDTSGADMIGSIGFSSCCLYRYQAVDVNRLTNNLLGDDERSRDAVAALLQSIVHALPGGKQTTLASPNPPSTVMLVVRAHGGESLANAFLKPVRADDHGDGLEEVSLQRLVDYWLRLRRMYGTDGIDGVQIATLYPQHLGDLAEQEAPSVADLIEKTTTQLT